MENITLEKKNVFVSYCHKDVTEEWIDKLATSLGQYGINCIVDIYDLQLGQDLNYFMEQIKKVDKVLILLGKEYKERANDRKAGVGTETQIISNDVYNDVEQTKFIPIVVNKDENEEAYLPYYLESRLYTDFSNDDLFAEKLNELIRQIHKLPKRVKPPVLDPPSSLIRYNSVVSAVLINENLSFDELKMTILEEMGNIKSTYEEYDKEKDEIILKKIEDSKELRDVYIKCLCKMLDKNNIEVEDIVSLFEETYNVAYDVGNGTFYTSQNDSCKFLLQEMIIYTVAILFKKRCFEEMVRLIKTTYFPEAIDQYTRNGIRIDEFYYTLESLETRNKRLKLNRRSLHADIILQRAFIKDINLDFSDIQLADCLILVLTEWFYRKENNYAYWYPVTSVYAQNNGFLKFRKYLISKSRFKFVQNLFEVNNEKEFILRYNELSSIFENDKNARFYRSTPSICSIVKPDELFSKE
ncbi:TIR domain-containing protein [bacterium 0.1xD8-71]|nr:TIR domain-containing protein [bacterium 0.1xD8-71]